MIYTHDCPDGVEDMQFSKMPTHVGFTYSAEVSTDTYGIVNALNPRDTNKTLAHHRMMHIGEELMDRTKVKLKSKYGTRSLPTLFKYDDREKLSVCDNYPAGKAKSKSFPSSVSDPILTFPGQRM